MLERELRLGPAVAHLLAEVGADGVAAVVPDERGGAESDRVSPVLEAPADVDVVAGRVELRVEPADVGQRAPAERHIAARDVLGGLVVEEHVRRPAGCGGDGGGDDVGRGRRDVRPPDGDAPAVHERLDQVREPIGIRHAVRVGVGDHVSGRRGCPGVAGRRQPEGILPQDHQWWPGHGRVRRRPLGLRQNAGRVVGGAIVHDDHLEIGIAQPCTGAQTIGERARAVADADDDRDARGGLGRERKRSLVDAPDRVERELRLARGVDEPEGPVVDVPAAGEPFVGPGEHVGAGDASGERRAQHPVEHRGLFSCAVAPGIDAELGEDQRASIGQVLEACQVTPEGLRVVQVHVHGEEVGGRARVEVLGGRKRRVADQHAGRVAPHRLDESCEEGADGRRPVPADDVGRNLVADEEAEERGVTSERPGRLDDGAARPVHGGGLVQEEHVLRPGHGHEDGESRALGGVEQPDRRDRVRPDRVDADSGHRLEVGAHAVLGRKLLAVVGAAEGAVGDPPQVELTRVPVEEFPGGRRACVRRSGKARALRRGAEQSLGHGGERSH